MILREFKKRAQHIAPSILVVAVISYIAYHLIQGDRGLVAWFQLNKVLAEKKDELKTLQREREILERRVRLLRPQHVDKDMLDEQVRHVLGFVGPEDLVVVQEPAVHDAR